MAKKNQAKVDVASENTAVEAIEAVESQLMESSEVEAVEPPKVLGKMDLGKMDLVPERRKSSWAELAQAKSATSPEDEKLNAEVNKLVSMTSFYMFFLLKTYCSNHRHATKAEVEEAMSKVSVKDLYAWRDFLYQKVSYLQEKENPVTKKTYSSRTLNTVPPEWSDIPESIRNFLDAQIHPQFNILLLAKQLTQAVPSNHEGTINFSSPTVKKCIESEDRYCNALCWWAEVNYPNLDELKDGPMKGLLMEMYENRTQYKWWSKPSEVLRFADTPK